MRSLNGLSLNNLTLSSFSMIILELKHKKAIAMGNFEMSAALGMICGPSLGGLLYHHVGYTLSLMALASFNILLFVFCKINFQDLKPQSMQTR